MKTRIRLTVAVAAFALATFNLSAATLYVSLGSTNPIPPYATWVTAATNIQDAVDSTKSSDTVLVTNGVYSAASITNSIRLESVNGPLVTTIDGGGSQRCVYLGDNAVLSGLTLTNGHSVAGGGVLCDPSGIVTNCVITGNVAWGQSGGGLGGGVYGGTVYNCTLTGNDAASQDGPGGGGAYGSKLYDCRVTSNYACGAIASTLYNCTVTGNECGAWASTLYNCTVSSNSAIVGEFGEGGGAVSSVLYNCILTANGAPLRGGGAAYSFLYNCTLSGNSAGYGGGASDSTLYNCIVYGNTSGNYTEGTVLNYCLTSPLPTNGVGNITGPPMFMDAAGGDLRLSAGSPCIDAGMNLLGLASIDPATGLPVPCLCTPTDILGNTRFLDGNGDGIVAWDIGAYEFNSFRPPSFTAAPQLTPDGWKLSVTGEPNKWVHVQKSNNLKDWEDIWSGFIPAEGIKQVTDGDTGQRVMLYRATVPQ